MAKFWKVLPQKSANLIEQLLINRNIQTAKQQELFFNPTLSDFTNDLKINNISQAAKRILQAIKNQELIFVSGDYDVDGICGAAVLYLGLTAAGAKVLPYIPHRETEGYGLSKIGLDEALAKKAKLVISVDCGIVDFEEAAYAKDLNLDLIITDHHQPLKDKLPPALAIVHSTKMCGTAVAWCLVKDMIGEQVSQELLDLVAIATVADMMPMVDINRAFVKAGLIKLNSTTRVGLLALMSESGLSKGSLGAYEIGHMLAPRLNAVGRLEHALDALRLLCTKSTRKAFELAQLLGETNIRRQKLTIEAVEGARLQIKDLDKKIFVLADQNWNPGIIGLVAGRICEETHRPAIAIAVGEEHSKGSARSIHGINIIEIIRKCSDLMVAVGGHPGAAGFTIHTTKITEFRERMEALIDEEEITDTPVLEIEAQVNSRELSFKLAQQIAEFAPFGISNFRPILASMNMKLTELKTVGNGKHLKGKADGVDFIAFGQGELVSILGESGITADVAYNVEVNKFNGREKLQLMVKDFHLE